MDRRFQSAPIALALCFGMLLSGCTSAGDGLKAASGTDTSPSPYITSTQTVGPSARADATPAIVAPTPNAGSGGEVVSPTGLVVQFVPHPGGHEHVSDSC